jgi:hypothetical protein
MITAQLKSARGEEGGISTPAGLPRWGPRLAPALGFIATISARAVLEYPS